MFTHSSRFSVILLTCCISVFLVGCGGPEGNEDDEFAFTAEDIARFRELAKQVDNTLAPDSLEVTGKREQGVPYLEPLGPEPEEEAAVDLSLLDAYGKLRSGTDNGAEDTYKVTNTFLNVRAAPKVTAEAIGRLNQGDELRVLEFTDAAWARVLIPDLDREGYVAQRYIARITSDVNLSKEKEKYKGLYFVDFAFVNVRKGPDVSSEKVGELPSQALIRPLSMDDTWARVPFEGQEGYIAVQYLSPFVPNFLVRQDQYTLPILRYDFSDAGVLEQFSKHVQRLQNEGARFMTMQKFHELLLQQEKQDVRLPPKSVILAVTGITAATVDAVSDLLLVRKVPATLFLRSQDIGSNGITEKTIQTLIANGFDVQSGGHSGEDFRSLTNAQLSIEIAQSRRVLGEFTKSHVVAIAYPQGGVNGRVAEQAEEAGYLFGLGVAPDSTFTREQFLRLPSIVVLDNMDAEELVQRIFSGG
ncbi:hypothetical protein COU77_00150 [Candidatus Peregrinibacteria bacterium CG10_big_fil_rev_8_21_14_0_10_49_16]|nr:MAG: hypothetical protein COW95_04765 [Candidatus Peregrinibacteria bacterium CG22_combo_CG10-13_8_21_14_all_49_11]PIR52472.1 MAG: hypothetical protein COU77_00150 [Candidatus Peregrinibacteria bacterium CG10_big_fil_rev_8_21_14_0_10_49_16]